MLQIENRKYKRVLKKADGIIYTKQKNECNEQESQANKTNHKSQMIANIDTM